MRDIVYSQKTKRVALITGITGQDGSYLAEYLLNLDNIEYRVHGIIRRSSSFNTGRIDHIFNNPRLTLHYGDLTDSGCITAVISRIRPDEIYNLAAQSHVKVSFEMPEYTSNVDAMGIVRICEAIRSCGLEKTVRIYQASTSELYGGIYNKPQSEETPFHPRSPYAVAKQFAHWYLINQREAYNIFACNGICFNHESPRRGPTFVTRKITMAAAKLAKSAPVRAAATATNVSEDMDSNVDTTLYLGNIDALRDWGHARDYVEGMWMMLQEEKADDYVLATGIQTSVREFVEKTYSKIGLNITWKGSKEGEVGVDDNGITRVRIDPIYYRPSEVENLWGDYSKIKKVIGWTPRVSIDELVEEMVKSDINSI